MTLLKPKPVKRATENCISFFRCADSNQIVTHVYPAMNRWAISDSFAPRTQPPCVGHRPALTASKSLPESNLETVIIIPRAQISGRTLLILGNKDIRFDKRYSTKNTMVG